MLQEINSVPSDGLAFVVNDSFFFFTRLCVTYITACLFLPTPLRMQINSTASQRCQIITGGVTSAQKTRWHWSILQTHNSGAVRAFSYSRVPENIFPAGQSKHLSICLRVGSRACLCPVRAAKGQFILITRHFSASWCQFSCEETAHMILESIL